MSNSQQVAEIIRRQITPGSLMSVGASDFAFLKEQRGGLTFKARLALRGQSRARTMRVQVVLTVLDLYRVTVTYLDRGRYYDVVVADEIDSLSLPRTILNLDSFGIDQKQAVAVG